MLETNMLPQHQRDTYKRRDGFNWLKFMLQWFIRFSEFTAYPEFLFHLREILLIQVSFFFCSTVISVACSSLMQQILKWEFISIEIKTFTSHVQTCSEIRISANRSLQMLTWWNYLNSIHGHFPPVFGGMKTWFASCKTQLLAWAASWT